MTRLPRTLLTLVAALGLAAPAAATEWLPLRPGVRWSYEVRGELSRSIAGFEQSERLQGTREVQVRGASPKFAARPFEVLEALRAHLVDDAGTRRTKTEMRSSYVKPAANGLLIYGEEFDNPLQGGARQLVRHAEPIQLLPADPKRGQKWHVGTSQLDGLELALDGEVLGFQDAQTPAGVYRGCLKVKLTGTFSGHLSMEGMPVRVERGRYESTLWYAPDVGPVLVEEKQELTLTVAAGQTVTASEHSWRTLRDTNVVPAAPARRDTSR
jgi:hypothetical protein